MSNDKGPDECELDPITDVNLLLILGALPDLQTLVIAFPQCSLCLHPHANSPNSGSFPVSSRSTNIYGGQIWIEMIVVYKAYKIWVHLVSGIDTGV